MGEPQDQIAVSRARDDLTGARVGRYAIRSRLGAGGMGEVYLADDMQLKRSVALKRLAPQLRTDPRYHQRFLKEAERASALNHPHIAGVYDVLEEKGELFLVMEHVEGTTLRQRLQKPLNSKEFLVLAVQCAEALAAAHEKGIVHGDIKPENIMLTASGQVKILDFGVAKRLPLLDESGPTQTIPPKTSSISGTPAYMAPEVLLHKQTDGRADIFSLGVVFYEALTRRHPFLADSFMATGNRILNEEPTPVTQLNPQVPAEVEQVVAKMLPKDPAERYPTAKDLLGDLRAVQRGVSYSARPPALRPLLARHLETALLAGLAVMVLLVMVAIASLPSVRQGLKERLGFIQVPQEKHLVVLPFAVLGGDPQNQAFADGLTETLTAKLTQLTPSHSLQVVPAGDVRAQKVKTVDQARQELGVNLVLAGSLHRSRDMMRVTYTLVDANTRRQLRADTITASASDPFVVEDRVVASVLRDLEIELQPEERSALAAHGTSQPAAYDYYLRGRGYLQDYQEPENIDSAIAVFNHALEQDPHYALAYAGLGEAYWHKYQQSKNSAWIGQALTSCERAVASDRGLANGHTCLGFVYNDTGKYEQAVEQFQQAVELEPNNDDAYRGLASAYGGLGKLAEAEATYLRAIEARPSYWAGYRDLGYFYYLHGRYAEAEKRFRTVTELTPDNPRAYTGLGAIYHLMGQDEEAIKVLQKSLAIKPTPEAYTNLGTIYHFEQRYRDAVPMMEKAVELGGANYIRWGNLAETYYRVPELNAKATGAYRQAAQLAERQLTINPKDAEARAWLAVYWVRLKRKQEALTEIERARRLAAKDVNILFRAAQVYELAGNRDRALRALESAVEGGYSTEEVRRAANLAELRKDPRYQRLVAARPRLSH